MFKKDGVNSQPNVPVIDNRTTSSHMWLERFPGDGDTLPDGITEWFGSFFPTVRYSNRAMKKLLELDADLRKKRSAIVSGDSMTILL